LWVGGGVTCCFWAVFEGGLGDLFFGVDRCGGEQRKKQIPRGE
jgi:hypothetical protein